MLWGPIKALGAQEAGEGHGSPWELSHATSPGAQERQDPMSRWAGEGGCRQNRGQGCGKTETTYTP